MKTIYEILFLKMVRDFEIFIQKLPIIQYVCMYVRIFYYEAANFIKHGDHSVQ